MAGSAKANVNFHTPHGWEIQDTSHIQNVSLVQTHFLMECPVDGWRGWVHKDLLTTPL